VRLSTEERQTNADIYHLPLEQIPEYAATIGLREIMAADQVVLAAFGSRKLGIVRQCLKDGSTTCPAGFVLAQHKNAMLVLDNDAAPMDAIREFEQL